MRESRKRSALKSVLMGLIIAGSLLISGMPVNGQGLAETAWPMFHGNPQHTGLSPYDTSRVDGTLKWNRTVGDPDEEQTTAFSPVIGENGTIYVGTDDGDLYAIGPDGALMWKSDIGVLIEPSGAIDSEGNIWVSTEPMWLYEVGPDGDLRWSYRGDFGVGASFPVIGSDGAVYVSLGDSVYSIKEHRVLWRYQIRDSFSPPAIGADGTIYVWAYDGDSLYAINSNGTLKWNHRTGDSVSAAPAIGPDGTIYLGSADHNLYAINPDGTEKWWFATGDFIASTPAIGPDGTIYVTSADSRLYAINPDGTEKWHYSTGNMTVSSPAVGADGTIYFGSMDGNIYALNPDGSLKWKYSTEAPISSSPAIGPDGTVYILSSDGNLYAFGPSSTGDGKGSTNPVPFLGLTGMLLAISVAYVSFRRKKEGQ